VAVRNFYIECDIDGRTNTLTGGPGNREGGFSMVIKQRDRGSIIIAMKITGRADSLGNLVLEAEVSGGDRRLEVITTRD
jgi:hypothetical protein